MSTRWWGPLAAVVLLVSGCQTAPTPAGLPVPVPMLGRPIEDVLNLYPEGRVEYFDATGKKLGSLPIGRKGSVSIFFANKGGQENFAFDQGGIVIRHQYSYGDDYHQGVWTDVLRGPRPGRTGN